MLKISECVCDSARADDQECAQRLRPILDQLAADLAPSTYSAFYDTWFVGFAYNTAGLIAGH